MNFEEFKIRSLGIDKEKFGRIFTFVDFGNVNYWYEQDEKDGDGNFLPPGNKLVVDIEKLSGFINLFSGHQRFYFGLDMQNAKSIKIISKARRYFDQVVTKPIQRIKHYLDEKELSIATRFIKQDKYGHYVNIPKCNFDVEICIDAVRLLDKYDTFCLFSSDSDFVRLLEFLKRKTKQIILVKSGYVQYALARAADLVMSAQVIKKSITFMKAKPRL